MNNLRTVLEMPISIQCPKIVLPILDFVGHFLYHELDLETI